jgi:quercetin dioxygenase-like cupin family protein
VPKPFVVLPENRSRAIDVVGEKITVLASKQDPPHSHDWDESFFVLNGNVQFGFDGDEMLATPGTLVHLPAGTEHWFKFESDDGQMLSVTGLGSGAAAFFTQVDADVSDGSDIEALGVVAAKHRVSIGPPGE